MDFLGNPTRKEAHIWHFVIFGDRAGQFRWRLVAPNGLIVADSGEGYATRFNARTAAVNVRRHIGVASIEDVH